MQWHRIWLTPSYIEYIALPTAVTFNTGHPSAVSRSRQLKAALQVFPHYKVPLAIRYSWKRLRKRRSKNLIKFSKVYIPFVLQYIHCFEKKNTYWFCELWETRLPKRLKCNIVVASSLAFSINEKHNDNRTVLMRCLQNATEALGMGIAFWSLPNPPFSEVVWFKENVAALVEKHVCANIYASCFYLMCYWYISRIFHMSY